MDTATAMAHALDGGGVRQKRWPAGWYVTWQRKGLVLYIRGDDESPHPWRAYWPGKANERNNKALAKATWELIAA